VSSYTHFFISLEQRTTPLQKKRTSPPRVHAPQAYHCCTGIGVDVCRTSRKFDAWNVCVLVLRFTDERLVCA